MLIAKKPRNRGEFISLRGLFLVVVVFILLGSFFDLAFLNNYVERAGVWAPLVFILAKASTIIFAPLSGTPLYVFAGVLFGIEKAILFAFLGDVLGFSILFFLTRKYGLRLIRKITNPDESKILKMIQSNTKDIKSFLKVCLLFIWFPEACVIAAGLGKIDYKKMMLVFLPIDFLVTTIIIFSSYNLIF